MVGKSFMNVLIRTPLMYILTDSSKYLCKYVIIVTLLCDPVKICNVQMV